LILVIVMMGRRPALLQSRMGFYGSGEGSAQGQGHRVERFGDGCGKKGEAWVTRREEE
jgi:hypothetical protein